MRYAYVAAVDHLISCQYLRPKTQERVYLMADCGEMSVKTKTKSQSLAVYKCLVMYLIW